MKSSYKLYGSFWDGRLIPEMNLDVRCEKDKTYENIIKISNVLSAECPEQYQCIEGKPIVLQLDYFPSGKSSVFVEFFVKRVIQIADYYNAEIVECNNQDDVDVIKNIIDDLTKRKTPDKLLAQSYGVFQMIC